MLDVDVRHPLTKMQDVKKPMEHIFEILLKTGYVEMLLVGSEVQGHSCNAKLECRYH